MAANQLSFPQTANISTFDIQDSSGMSLLGYYQRQVSPFTQEKKAQRSAHFQEHSWVFQLSKNHSIVFQ
jgi:hypothetical protein